MAAQFALKMVFRVHSVPLLKEYMEARGQAAHFTFDTDHPNVEQLFQQWESLSPEARNGIEAELRAVHDLATSDTELTTILEEAEFHDKAEELRQAFATVSSLHDKVLLTLLRYPRIFQVANIFERTEHLNSRSWKKRRGLPKSAPRDDAETCKSLAEALRQFYVNREGRGRYCHVEPYKRGDEVYYYVYLEDHARLGVTFDSQGDFQRQTLKDSFEIIYRFNPIEGSLETFVQGNPRVIEEVQKFFARVCLDIELPPPTRRTAAYAFNKLLRRNFVFTTDPEDGVKSTRVKSLRLWINGTQRKITLTEGNGDNPGGVYDLLDQITSNEASGLHRALLEVTRAELQMVFRGEPGHDDKTLTFAISWPDWCNLKDNREHLIAKKYLNLWLALDEPAAADTPQPALAG